MYSLLQKQKGKNKIMETPKSIAENPQNMAAVEHDPFVDGLDSNVGATAEQHVPAAEMANRERVIAAVGQIARESALSNEEQQHVVAEQEQRELVHH
jgi:hypothetical protein